MISLLLFLALSLRDGHAYSCPCDSCCMERSGDTYIDLTPVKP